MRPGPASIVLAFVVMAGCSTPSEGASSSASSTSVSDQSGGSNSAPPLSGQPSVDGVELILVGGSVVTMTGAGVTDAIAVDGNTIAAVGSESDILALATDQTQMVDLQGRVVFPGFIDSHSHWYQPNRIGDYGPEQINQVLLSRGWTATNDLNVEPHFADQFFGWHEDGRIDLRMNAYLSLNTPGSDQDRHMDWFSAYDMAPGTQIGDRLTIPGVKVFIASDWDRIVKWNQDELNDVVAEYHRAGWQVAAKQISDESLDMAITAFDAVRKEGDDRRHRLEHALELRSDQIDRAAEIGLVPIVQLGGIESDMALDPGFHEMIADDGLEAVWPLQDMLEAGMPLVGSIAVVPLEGVRSPFTMSVMQMLHGAITGISEVGAEPWPGRENQLMTIEQALESITWRAAWSTFEEGSRGSLAEGMLADLVVMSDDLREASRDPEILRSVTVDANFIDGELMWCGFGLDEWCGGFGQPIPERLLDESTLAPLFEGDVAEDSDGAGFEITGMTVTASASRDRHTPELAFDGIQSGDSFWSSGTDAPGWLEVEFDVPQQLRGLRFVVFQNPSGDTNHVLEVRLEGTWVEAEVFSGFTDTGDVLEWTNGNASMPVEAFRITTTASVSWPEWYEIELVARNGS